MGTEENDGYVKRVQPVHRAYFVRLRLKGLNTNWAAHWATCTGRHNNPRLNVEAIEKMNYDWAHHPWGGNPNGYSAAQVPQRIMDKLTNG